MPHELTHASFFSGVGGLDMGLERAGWRTVSFSEIDPYASAVLAERWPGVPNLGDITAVSENRDAGCERYRGQHLGPHAGRNGESCGANWCHATLWTGGFPCQDLSVAGKRRGMGTDGDRTRSGLAYAFLDLVERHRPPAILLENVPGLLSSNGGKDLGALLGRLGQLGYWWAYRILDAQFFGVPQRRRRVFICALHAGAGFGADSAAAVLSVGARCGGHSQESDEAGQGASGVLADGARSTRTVQSAFGHHGWTLGAQDVDGGYLQLGPSPDSDRMREADGMAGRLDDRVHPSLRAGGHGSPGIGRDGDEDRLVLSPTLRVGPQRPQDGGPGDTVPIIAATLNSGGNDGGFRTEPGEHLVAYRKAARVNADPDSPESWVDDGLANTLNNFDVGDVRTTHAVVGGRGVTEDEMLPLGLDSHRYRCCGNGVVSNVAEWIGVRLARAVESVGERAA